MKGTIFEDTRLGPRMRLHAMHLVDVSRKGVPALRLQRELGIGSCPSAWRMPERIRSAMEKEEHKETSEAVVEIDETCAGGKPRKENGHDEEDGNKSRRGRGTARTPATGVKGRNTGKVHAVAANCNGDGRRLSGKQLLAVLKRACKPGTTVMTDKFTGYGILDGGKDFVRLKAGHTATCSLGDGIRADGIENFWPILKRGVYGVFHDVSAKRLRSQADEFCFRINRRDNAEAFNALVRLAAK